MNDFIDPMAEKQETNDSPFLPILAEARTTALAQLEKIRELYEKVVEIHKIETDEQAVAVTGMKAAIQTLKKGYDQARKDAGSPLRETLNRIQVFFEEGLGLLDKANNWVAGLQKNFLVKKEQERRAQQSVVDKHVAEMQQEFNKQSQEMGFTPVTVAPLTVPKAEGPIRGANGASTHMRKTWKHEILDATKVPREYCEPSAKLIRAAVDAGVRNIEGVRIWEDETPVTRTK